jgi:hypothetical protein
VTVESTANPYKLTVSKATEVKALFVRDIFSQTVTIARGWNWMSTYLNELQTLGDVAQYANRIVSQESELIKDPVYGLVGGIDAFVPGKAYKIEASTRFSRTMRGHIYNTTTAPITLKKGWNWMAYPYHEARTLDVLTNAEEGDYITAQTGYSEYANGSWEGTLTELTPGIGYLYKSASNKPLAYNFEAVAGSRAAYPLTRQFVNTSGIDIHRYPSTMSITARICRDGMEQASNAYIIYAMTGKDICGISQVIGNNHYLTVYGEKPVEVTFVVESAETGETFIAAEKLTFVDDVVGSRKSPFVFNISSATGIKGVYDSPTHDLQSVYDLQGRKIANRKSLNSKLAKGVYIVNGQKYLIK